MMIQDAILFVNESSGNVRCSIDALILTAPMLSMAMEVLVVKLLRNNCFVVLLFLFLTI